MRGAVWEEDEGGGAYEHGTDEYASECESLCVCGSGSVHVSQCGKQLV